MSRPAVVAAFIAGAALVAVAMVVMSPAERAPPSLEEKLMMLKSYKAQALREQNNQMLDALGVPANNGRCPGSAGDFIFQDGMCYQAHVCYLPTDIYCSRGVGACGDETTKTTCGSGADKAPCQSGVNYKAGWTLPQGCSSTCAVRTLYFPWRPQVRAPPRRRRALRLFPFALRKNGPVQNAIALSQIHTHLRAWEKPACAPAPCPMCTGVACRAVPTWVSRACFLCVSVRPATCARVYMPPSGLRMRRARRMSAPAPACIVHSLHALIDVLACALRPDRIDVY